MNIYEAPIRNRKRVKKYLFTALFYIVSLCASNAQVVTMYFPQKNALENKSFAFEQSVKIHREDAKKFLRKCNEFEFQEITCKVFVRYSF
jgi:hypothetical protein